MIRSKKKYFSITFLLFSIMKSVLATEVDPKISEMTSSAPLKNSQATDSVSSMTRLDLLEEEVSNLNQKFWQLKSRNMNPKNSETIQVIPEIVRMSKILDRLQSTDEETRSGIYELNGRVSRLEMGQQDEGHHLENTNRRNRRQTKQTLNSTVSPCSIKACAFDYKVIKDNITAEKKIPKNCKDLYDMGHVLNGFYHIQAHGKIELAFCDFRSSSTKGRETRIGYIDIKSAPVYFFVQKYVDQHTTLNTPMPFEIEIANIGRAIDIKTGVFVAPKPGIYYFAFSGIRHNFAGETILFLQLNGENVACGHGAGAIQTGGLTMALHSTLQLRKNDKVSLVLAVGSITAYYSSTSFVGWLVEEENVAIN